MASRSAAVHRLADHRDGAVAPEDRAAGFEDLYRKYWPRLVALCRRRVGDEGLAEDVAQETLLRALVHIDELDAGRPLWPWLKTTAVNLIIDHARKHSRVVTCETHDERASEERPSVEDADLLRQAIGSLPGRQRAAVALRYINDWDSNDAAEWLGLSRPAYEQLLFRARRRLRMEYHRIAGDVLSGITVSTATLRAALRRLMYRMREATAAPAGEITSLTATQLVGGALSLVVTLGGQAPAALAPSMAAAMRPVAQRAGKAARLPAPSHRVRRTIIRGAARGNAPSVRLEPSNQPATRSSTDDLVRGVTNEGVQQPEDTHVTSVVLSPAFDRDHTMFAAGRAECPESLCSSVLFQSLDGGATWQRLDARGFDGEDVILPPSFGNGDSRIFAMGRTGLQVSEDGGESFVPAGTTTAAAYVAGSAAISPAFDRGDPSILIGSQTLMRYRDDTKTIEPVPSTTGVGPLDPKFSPQRPSDTRIVVGAMDFNPDTRSWVSSVHVCWDSVCNVALLDLDALPASVRLAPDFGSSNLVYAFTQWGAYASTDGAGHFNRLLHFSSQTFVQDLAIGKDGRLFLSATGAEGGLYTSGDGGVSWTRVDQPMFGEGAGHITAQGDLVVVSLAKSGFACSIDGGATWAPRCGSAP